MLKRSGKFIAPNAVAYHLQLGFVPDKFSGVSALGGTEKRFEWYKVLHELGVTGQYGIDLGNTGTTAIVTTAATGAIPYEETVQGVEVPAPAGKTPSNPTGFTFVPAGAAAAASATISDWLTTVNYNTTGQDRSATVPGTCVRPIIHNGRIFELKTGVSATGGTGDAVATWNVAIGAEVTDTNANVWICREERPATRGAKGIELGATLMINGDIWVFDAELHDETKDHGDGDEVNPSL